MSNLVPLIVVGLVSGSVYGLAAVGLVVTYKTSRVFNFAHGAIGTLAAYVFYALHVQAGLPWPLAAAIVLIVVGGGLGLGFQRYGKILVGKSFALRVVGTIGILVVIEAVCTQVYGTSPRTFPAYLPTSTFTLFGARVGWDQLTIFAVSAIGAIGLAIFFRTARLGKAMRAVTDDESLLDLSGTSPSTVRRLAWIIGCGFATLSGLLLAPSVSLDAQQLSLLVIEAFGAAAIGGFSSLPRTWAGGLIIGVVSSVATLDSSNTGMAAGIPAATPFLILFAVLLVYPKSRVPFDGARRMPNIASAWSAPAWARTAGAVIGVVFLLAVPYIVGYGITSWTTALTMVMLFVSLGLVVRHSGQVSLCQLGFAAVGAAAFSKLCAAGVPWVIALLLVAVIAAPLGALLAAPAIRLGGVYLALATLAFGLVLQDIFYQSSWMFGFGVLGINMPRPDLNWISPALATGYYSDLGFYYVVVLIVVLTLLITTLLTGGRLGRLLRALGESQRTVATSGVSVTTIQILVFSLSAGIAAIAGALSGVTLTTVTGTNFNASDSIVLLAVVVVSVGGEPWYALFGAGLYSLVSAYYPSQTVTDVLQVVFGVAAIGYSLGHRPQLPRFLRDLLDRRRHLLKRPAGTAAGKDADGAAPDPAPVAPGSLDVQKVSVRFGGLQALNDVELSVKTGSITGLIGPNGAGKTTLFNVCSGVVSPSAGAVSIDGRPARAASMAVRARRGIGRTFQQMELLESQSVLDNVKLGCEGRLAGRGIVSHVLGRPGERATIDARAREALSLCGLTELADAPVHVLSTGQRRLVELARCLAGEFKILLLDEPASGLDEAETAVFGDTLRRAVAQRGLGVLLVEHDLNLVMELCVNIYVLEFGKILFEGDPAQLRDNPEVQRAYLGTSTAGASS